MALDRKLLHRARIALDERRHEREREYAERLERVYSRNPRVRELDSRMRSTVAEAVRRAMSRGEDPAQALEELREENLDLQSERIQEIMAAGFEPDYLDDEYFCKKCRDTGYDGTRYCSCLMELYREEQKKSLSSLLKLGDETFDSFDLKWYGEEKDPRTGITDRQHMEFVYETCVVYARRFGEKSTNLFFSGATGLGKTFLSACIARVVAENGFSVVYDTASAVMNRFEEARFGRCDDPEEARQDVKRFLECDLFILDDLGTEFTNSFTASALYELINTRLTTGRKTIISSNLTQEELRKRYSAQIVSRLEGEYQTLLFVGKDIRRQKAANS